MAGMASVPTSHTHGTNFSRTQNLALSNALPNLVRGLRY